MSTLLSVDEQLDLARAIGLVAEVRQASAVLACPASQRQESATRLDGLLTEYDAAMQRLAELVIRHADRVRTGLDDLRPQVTPTGEPNNAGGNAVTNAAVQLRDVIDVMHDGDVAAYARSVAGLVRSGTNSLRATITEGAES
jgi:alpha-D-ribose 1-methylphosphonate 5-triphosphate synthase subunit PhnG